MGEDMEQFQVIFYTKGNGSQPAREFLDGLSPKMRTRFAKLIVLLREEGGKLRMPHSEYLKDGIFQIRAQQEGNIARVLYFFWDGQKIILTNGFTKKTQKTPPVEIERAKRYKADYERREADKK